MTTQIITDIGIIKCPMGYKTTKKCHHGEIACIGSDVLKLSACVNLHICRNVKNEMGMVEEEDHGKKI